jgi:hypothetical protein
MDKIFLVLLFSIFLSELYNIIECNCAKNFTVYLSIQSDPSNENDDGGQAYTVSAGTTVIELLKMYHTVDTEMHDGWGLYVKAIDGVSALWDVDLKVWHFYLNSEPRGSYYSEIYQLKPDDIIIWRIAQYDR